MALWPNESYVEGECSEWEWHPHCWNIAYIGFENKLWKTENGGSSFELVHAFGTNPAYKLSDIEIAWSDPQIMYVVQRTANRKIWRTLDGGLTWTEATPAGSVTGNNNWRNMALAVDKQDPLTLWMMLTYGPNGNKVYRTIDGGLSWENMTTPVLNDFSPYSILHQYGTGGVYLGCRGGIFYRNNDMNDWELHGEGFPLSAEPNLLKPFYRDGKIRTATWNRSIWQADFYEPSPTFAQVGVDKLVSQCLRDTFYFEDHSILQHGAGVSWEWAFPGGNPATSNLRNPKVIYNVPGTYSVSLTITDMNGEQSTQELGDFLTVIDGCNADTIPGFALGLGGNDEPGYAVIPTLGTGKSNTFTISAWIKPNGPQPSYAGLVMRENAAGINLRDNNELGFHWGGEHWWLSSGLTVTENNWSHVALVIQPEKATLYLNGVGVSFNATCDSVSLEPSTQIGKDRGWDSRHFKGEMDEICIWNRSLSQEEIRELRHLTKDPLADTTLLAYYQFNELEGVVLDRARIYHAALAGSASRIVSNVPAGKGVSKRLEVSTPGSYAFDNTGATLEFGPTVPGGEVVLSRLVVPVDTVPDPLWPSTHGYWILNHYGANPFFDNPSMALEGAGPISAFDAQHPEGLLLYRRYENGFGPAWFSWDVASGALEGTDGTVLFEDGTSIAGGAQWLLVNTNEQISAARELKPQPAPIVQVFPNPLPSGQGLTIQVGRLESCRVWLFDATGRRVARYYFEGPEGIWQDMHVPSGVYYYQVIGERFIQNGVIEVK
ncbi:MAG: PKD domain-containing protein [Saprospirales bacterium]|nr:PKD domain-containing protein [Saprospirales bacterium]